MSREVRVANALLDTKAVMVNVEEPFTYASGIKSPIYCDNRSVLGFLEERDIIIEGFLELIPDDVDVIVGIATAGIPWGAIIAYEMQKPFAYIRSEVKAHGAGKQIEGADIKDKKIAVIEDLISTGGSSLKAVDIMKKIGVAELTVYAIFTYEMKKAEENFKNHDTELITLSNFSILISELEKSGYLSTDNTKLALEWNKSPETWRV